MFPDNIERVHIDNITVHEFIEKYEKGSRPVIIQGVAEGWPAWQTWKVNVSLQVTNVEIRNLLSVLEAECSSAESLTVVESSK